jgi:DNA-binding LacI/PurR family transcriptional regulator
MAAPTARVTLQTISGHLVVSRTAVSNAYNRPDQLGDDLRTRILQVRPIPQLHLVRRRG